MAKRQIVVDEVSSVTLQGPKGPFQKINIKSGGHKLSAYPSGWNARLEPGDRIEVDVVSNTGKDGRTYYNIKSGRVLNTKQDLIIEKLDKILAVLGNGQQPLPVMPEESPLAPIPGDALPPGEPMPLDESEAQPEENLPF